MSSTMSSPRTCTLVSCYYRTPTRKHTHEEYEKWMQNFLGTVETPLVVFCEEEYAPLIRSFRKDLPLTLILQRFEDLDMMQPPYGEHWERDHLQDKEKHKQHPMLYALWNEKFRFVERVIELNPYQTEWFGWVDIGCFRSTEGLSRFASFPSGKRWEELEGGLLYLQQVHPFFPSDLTVLPNGLTRRFDLEDRLSASIMLGDPLAWKQWNAVYYPLLDRYLAEGYFAGEEQNIMATTVILHPEVAYVMIPPANTRGDLWFFFQEIFSS